MAHKSVKLWKIFNILLKNIKCIDLHKYKHSKITHTMKPSERGRKGVKLEQSKDDLKSMFYYKKL